MSMKKIAFIGGGNMGKSIIGGMIKNNYSNELIYVATPFETEVYALKETFKVNVDTSNINIVNECDVVVFAVKPQVSNEVFTELKKANIDFSNKLIITIMAGVKTEKIAANLKNAEKIIRVMPNTPALIGEGLTGMYKGANCNDDDVEVANCILGSCSKTVWVEKEEDIDSITAISGSAPAYFYLFMECLINKAKEYNFDEATARKIIEQVAIGSAKMVIQNSDTSIAQLRENVTSKGGTTYEALKVFNECDINGIISKALDACKNRAEELSK